MYDITTRITRLFFRDFDVEWRWPSSVPKDEWDRIEFESAGADLAGVFGEADGEPSAAVVLAHPQKVSAKGFFLRSGLPGALRAEGYDVFAFDFNGFGESERGSVEYYPDIVAAIDTVERLSEAPNVAVVGVSMGGAFLVPALAKLDDDAIDAAIFDSVYTRTSNLIKRRSRIKWAGIRIGEILRPSRMRVNNPIEYADAVSKPDELLFIFGENDSLVPPKERRRLVSAFPHDDDDVDVWIVPETDHVYPIIQHQERYIDKVCGYLDDRCADGE